MNYLFRCASCRTDRDCDKLFSCIKLAPSDPYCEGMRWSYKLVCRKTSTGMDFGDFNKNNGITFTRDLNPIKTN